jgi:hypothetical protein
MVMNKDEIDAVAKAAAEIVKATPVYQDAVQPVAQEVGKSLKTIGGVINVALTPIALMVFGFEKIQENLKSRLEKRLVNIPPENIVTPNLQVVGPLIEKYKYVSEDQDLSQMFINLLANAMDKDKVSKAHPSFVNIISELSPDEAKIIKALSKKDTLPKIDIKLQAKKEDGTLESGYHYFATNYTNLPKVAGLAYPELINSYLNNLERIQIISCTSGQFQESFTEKNRYKELEENEYIKNVKKETENTFEMSIVHGLIRVTDFGKLFIDAVVSE